MRHLLILLVLIFSTQFFWAQTNFSEVSQSIGIDFMNKSQMKMGGGVAVLDFDNDGWEDLFVTGGLSKNGLFRNNGDGTFSESLAPGLFADSAQSMGVVTGDIDNDGYREIYITTAFHEENILYYNNGDGTFTDITTAAGLVPAIDSMWSTSAAFGDVNNDGFLDLYVINYVDSAGILEDSAGNAIGYSHICYANSLYMNNGNLTFTESSSAMGVADAGCGLAVAFTDFDSDRDVDILIANDFGEWVLPSSLLQNDFAITGNFTDISVTSGMDAQMYGMGIAIGDYDQDMDLDYYVTNIGAQRLFCQESPGMFVDTSEFANVRNEFIDTTLTTGWGTAFFDMDNDTYIDLFVAHGHITLVDFFENTLLDPDKAFLNNGDGTFTDVSDLVGLSDSALGRGLTYADFDQDGDIDLVINPVHWDTLSGQHVNLYDNTLSNGNNFAQVSLQGTISNRDAFGAQIAMYTNGKSWLHEINGGSSHMSQTSSIAHFGMGSAVTIDSMIIYWPSGLIEKKFDYSINKRHTFIEGTGNAVGHQTLDQMEFYIYPNPTTDIIQIRTAKPYYSLLISTISGQIIEQHTYLQELDLSHLSAGVYLLSFTSNEGVLFTRKIVKH
jgi:hypothetical protein